MALPFLAVAAFWAALITTLVAPGPILFRQERVGLRGRRFQIFKFRTMHTRADVTAHQAHFTQLMQSNAPMQKLDARGDKRLIPGGWLLRASGLDELPQIINVLRGEMSIVGPRPCIVYEYEQYTARQRKRLESVPGLTGLWQVSGKNRTTFEEMIELDLAYGQRRSFWFDLGIILRTVPALCVQVADIRRSRRAPLASQPQPAAPAIEPPAATPVPSATFAAKTQNVIVETAAPAPILAHRGFAASFSALKVDVPVVRPNTRVDSGTSVG